MCIQIIKYLLPTQEKAPTGIFLYFFESIPSKKHPSVTWSFSSPTHEDLNHPHRKKILDPPRMST